MGEYATRVSDGAEVKIGTCESMYYLRFEDRHKVRGLRGNVDPNCDTDAAELRFRIPFPDEDGIEPGGCSYKEYNRGVRLFRMVGPEGRQTAEDWTDESKADDAGIIQLHHAASGLLINVPCYHGLRLPTVTPPMQAFWNGKGHSFELSMLRAMLVNGKLRVFPVVRCRHCGNLWRYQWETVLEYIHDPKLWARLAVYAADTVQAA